MAGAAGADLFATRVALNALAFNSANRDALEEMRGRYGVRYLLVDQVNGFPVNARALRRVAQGRVPGARGVRVEARGR